MLANQLARRGVRAMIIDRHSGPAQQTRAMAVHARTLEIYAKMGLTERAFELGMRADAANMWTNGHWGARLPLGDIGRSMSPFPFVLMLGQDDNEHIMGEKLRTDFGIAVQWNTELTALVQRSDHVVASLKQSDGTSREVRAAWVAGCDGARSAVRELNDIGFPGAPYEHVFFVADTVATGSMKPGELNIYLWQDGFHLFFPMRGKDRWRVIGILPKELRGRDDVSFDELIPGLRHEAGSSLLFKECSWFSTYRIYHRAAERFRDRRCFLLGDAAHIHSPMGAQGMNTGLQDAYNFAWKLALVVKGRADPALLDTYEEDRVPVAERLLQTTDRAFQLVVSESWLAGLFRTRIMARVGATAMTIRPVRELVFRTVSQIGIRYPNSRLSQTLGGLPKQAPAAGERFPWLHLKLAATGSAVDLFQQLDDTRFNLLVIGQPAPAPETLGLGDLIRVHAVCDDAANAAELARVHIKGPAFYLLRPDGHVGLAGTRLDAEALKRYMAERVRLVRDTQNRTQQAITAA
jgi:2-polyprenyl-6-methoxyphenol hydroxylase-like FAD-dependent oxidoreductase